MTSDLRFCPCRGTDAVEPAAELTIGEARGGVGTTIEYGVAGVTFEPNETDSRLTGLTTSIKSLSELSSDDSFLTPFRPEDFSAALADQWPFGSTVT
jgi:hypothetical protein